MKHDTFFIGRFALLGLLFLLTASTQARDYQVLDSYPHYSGAFTQGLLLHDGYLYESSGLYGRSFVIYGNLKTSVRKVRLPKDIFAEGLTLLRDRLYLLTWRRGVCLILDPLTLELQSSFRYKGEGWGLTHDGQHLIVSDGSDTLRFLDPDSGEVVRRLSVSQEGKPVTDLNELEWHRGLILANQWKTDELLVIDDTSGEVRKRIDLSGLYPPAMRRKDADVLNGIAYDAASDSWLVTGKYWPRIYRLSLTLPPAGSAEGLQVR